MLNAADCDLWQAEWLPPDTKSFNKSGFSVIHGSASFK